MKPHKLISNNNHNYSLYFDADSSEKVFDVQLSNDENSLINREDWNRLIGPGAAEALEECVLCFNQAKHFMQQQVGALKLVGSEKEVAVKSKMMIPLCLQSIESQSKDCYSYKVTFDCEGQKAEHTFKLRTDGTNSTGIDWDEQFWINLDGELSVAKPLFGAIAAFYTLSRATCKSTL